MSIEDLVREAVRRHYAMVETACEMALLTGEWGVLVDEKGARPDPSVPYGQIYEVRP